MPRRRCKVCQSQNLLYYERLKSAGYSIREIARRAKKDRNESIHYNTFKKHFSLCRSLASALIKALPAPQPPLGEISVELKEVSETLLEDFKKYHALLSFCLEEKPEDLIKDMKKLQLISSMFRDLLKCREVILGVLSRLKELERAVIAPDEIFWTDVEFLLKILSLLPQRDVYPILEKWESASKRSG